jgi:hypothetical protein
MSLTRLRYDDRGSMPMAMLVISVGLVLSAALTPLVVRQLTSTRNLANRVTALNAAQAGMDVMMARVRAASEPDNGNYGLLENLPPCLLTGDAGLGEVGETLTYRVTVLYKDQDGVALTCPVEAVPTTAVVTSTGRGKAGAGRTLTATYVFTTSNTNIPGGQIRIDTSTLGDQCLDAGPSRSPAVGTRVMMKRCSGASSQQFGYTSDLYLKLIYSESTTAQYGMCLDTLPTHAANNFVQFDKCPVTIPPTRRFQWSLDCCSQFHATSAAAAIQNLCITVDRPGIADSYLVLAACTGGTATTNIWRSDPGAGAGMAGDATWQMVNYEQFSRCLDVTSQSTGSTYMIAWYCKQSPTGAVDWNQIWVHPVPVVPAVSATGNIIVTTDGSHAPNNTPHCLKSPLSTASNAYTTVVNCGTAAAANKALPETQWTVFHDTGDYTSSYRIQDNSGYCLTPTSQKAIPKDAHGDGTSKVKVAVCNNSELQKWNAPPNINKPTPLTDLTEK